MNKYDTKQFFQMALKKELVKLGHGGQAKIARYVDVSKSLHEERWDWFPVYVGSERRKPLFSLCSLRACPTDGVDSQKLPAL